MLPRLCLSVVPIGALLLLQPALAHADEPVETRWYGYQTLAADGAGVLLPVIVDAAIATEPAPAAAVSWLRSLSVTPSLSSRGGVLGVTRAF